LKETVPNWALPRFRTNLRETGTLVLVFSQNSAALGYPWRCFAIIATRKTCFLSTSAGLVSEPAASKVACEFPRLSARLSQLFAQISGNLSNSLSFFL